MDYDKVLSSTAVMLAKADPENREKYLNAAMDAAKSFREYFACYEALTAAGRKDEALTFLRQAADRVQFGASYISLAQCYRGLGMMDSWRRMLEKSECRSYGPEQDADCAYEYFCGGDLDKAREMLATAEENVDSSLDVFWCAKGYWKIGDQTRARKLLNQYCEDAEENFIKYDCLIEYSALTGEPPDQREEYYRKMAEVANGAEELIQVAFAMKKRGCEPSKWQASAEQAFEQARSQRDCLECRDFFTNQAMDYVKAAELLRREEELSPQPSTAFYQARSYLELGDVQNAVRRIKMDTTNPRRTEFLTNHVDLEIWNEVSRQEQDEYFNSLSQPTYFSPSGPLKNPHVQRKQKRKQQKSARRKNRRKQK